MLKALMQPDKTSLKIPLVQTSPGHLGGVVEMDPGGHLGKSSQTVNGFVCLISCAVLVIISWQAPGLARLTAWETLLFLLLQPDWGSLIGVSPLPPARKKRRRRQLLLLAELLGASNLALQRLQILSYTFWLLAVLGPFCLPCRLHHLPILQRAL